MVGRQLPDASPAQALARAREAAAGGDIRIGGGPSTIREFLAAGLIDYLHIVVAPIVLGRGERLWDGWKRSKSTSRSRP
jgi:dihydrofolate reductase